MDQAAQLGRNMEELQKQLQYMKKARMSRQGLLHDSDAAIIRVVARYHQRFEEGPTALKVSSILGVTQATVTPMIERLVKKGLIERKISPLDKRAKLLYLTEEAKDLMSQHVEQEQERMQALVEYLGEEDAQELTRILEKVMRYIEKSKVSE